jgi:hypothetical protein
MITCDSPEPAASHRVPLLKVGVRQCRFIVSDTVSDAVCCGAPTSDLSSWCAWHERVVFKPRLTERERRQAMLEAREVAARSVARVTHKAA